MPFKDPQKRKEYHREYHAKWYRRPEVHERQKQKVKERKKQIRHWFNQLRANLCCETCGLEGSDNPWAIEFHHRDSRQKRHEVSYMIANGYAKKTISAEIAKCKVLCANCHRELHRQEALENEDLLKEIGRRKKSQNPAIARRKRRKLKAQRRNRKEGGDLGDES